MSDSSNGFSCSFCGLFLCICKRAGQVYQHWRYNDDNIVWGIAVIYADILFLRLTITLLQNIALGYASGIILSSANSQPSGKYTCILHSRPDNTFIILSINDFASKCLLILMNILHYIVADNECL